MGQFSWIYCNTAKPVLDNEPRSSYLLIPEEFRSEFGGQAYIKEECYDGYGRFGRYDVYELISMWNKKAIPEILNRIENNNWRCIRRNSEGEFSKFSLRDIEDLKEFYKSNLQPNRIVGINMACYDEDNCSLPYPIKIASKPMLYENARPSVSDSNQGWNVRICEEDKKVYDAIKNGSYGPLQNKIEAASIENTQDVDFEEEM